MEEAHVRVVSRHVQERSYGEGENERADEIKPLL
jgi:hypothetical protein